MRLQLVVTFALVSSAFAQRNPFGTSGDMPRSGIPLIAEPRNFGSGRITPSNPGALPPGSRSGPGRIMGGRPYAAYGPICDADAGFDGLYSADASFDVPRDGYVLDGFYSHRAPYQAQPEVPTPTIFINEDFQIDPIHPQLRDYSNVKLPEPGTVLFPPSTAIAPPTQPALQPAPALADDQPAIFLIALQDHTIVPAIAYWVQG